MKILVDAHCFDYDTSEGINTYINGLYGALIRIARDMDFYFAAHNLEQIRKIFGEAGNVHYVQLTTKGKVRRLLTEFPTVIKEYGIDVAHYQYTAPLIKNCFTVVTLHDILFKDFPELFPASYRLSKGILFWTSAKRADLLLTVSEYSRGRISKHFSIPQDKILVTPNAVSEDFFSIDTGAARSFVQRQGIGKYVLYVSRIEPRKNQVAALKAWAELGLAQKGYHMVFIGRKTLAVPEFDAYLNGLDEATREHVRIYNQVDYEDLKLWYGAASLFLYPALAEGFGIPPIEAAAAGVPCVCNNKTAMGDFGFFGENLIDVSDTELFKCKIMAQLVAPADVEAVKHAVAKKYNWEAIASEFYNVLKARFSSR